MNRYDRKRESVIRTFWNPNNDTESVEETSLSDKELILTNGTRNDLAVESLVRIVTELMEKIEKLENK
jgi:hypothetical protein